MERREGGMAKIGTPSLMMAFPWIWPWVCNWGERVGNSPPLSS